MSTGTYETILADAKIAMRLWETHPELKLSDITLVAFQKTEKNFESVLDEVKSLESQLGAKMAERDDAAAEVSELITRTRSAVRGYFGPDSPEYAQLGCTRASDRKRPVRRTNGNGAVETAAKKPAETAAA